MRANDDLEDINRWVDAYADEFSTFRPHHALDGQILNQYLQSLAAKETPASHNVLNQDREESSCWLSDRTAEAKPATTAN